jgi:hypothetical protein
MIALSVTNWTGTQTTAKAKTRVNSKMESLKTIVNTGQKSIFPC